MSIANVNLQAAIVSIGNAQQDIDALQAQIDNTPQNQLSLKTPLKTIGWNGKLMAHIMCWFGEGKTHKITRLNSSDPVAIGNMARAAKLCGIDGFIATWFGLTNTFIDKSATVLRQACEQHGLLFAYLLDPWAAKMGTKTKEQAIIDSLNSPSAQASLASPAYVPEKFVIDFSTNADFSVIQPHFPDLKFWHKHIEYSWPETTNTMAVLKRDNANPAMKMPGIFPRFFDGGHVNPDGTRNWSQSVWSTSPTRVILPEAGNVYLDSVALVPPATPYASIVTGSDGDEETEILTALSMFTGIRFGN